jgi:hypothetical protein
VKTKIIVVIKKKESTAHLWESQMFGRQRSPQILWLSLPGSWPIHPERNTHFTSKHGSRGLFTVFCKQGTYGKCSVADPDLGYGVLLIPGSGIRDGYKNQDPDPG